MIDTICLGSGGLKGVSFLAALRYLEKHNHININNITTYTCVSVGALLGTCIVVGYTLDELAEIFKSFDFNVIKPDLNLDLMIDYYGLDNGETIINYFKNIILKKIKKNDITFMELYKLTNKELYIATTNFSKNTEKIFSFKETPDISIFLAIRMSISIPLIYTPVLYENDYYLDGALINNVYILEKSIPENTLIIKVNKYIPNEITSIKDILIGTIYIMSDQMIKKDINKYNCLNIDCLDVSFSSETDITSDIINLLYLNGECSAENYLRINIKNKIKELKKNINNKQINTVKDVLDNIITKIENNYL